MRSDSLATKSKLVSILLFVAFTCSVARTAVAQLDETWTVTVNGQTVPVSSNGGFVVPNISVVDLDPVDFIGDDFLRVVAINSDATLFGISDPFQIAQAATFIVGDLQFTTTPPPLPVSLTLSSSSVLLELDGGAEAFGELTTMATNGDGTQQNVTLPDLWTAYRSSNPDVVSVAFDEVNNKMIITAQGLGTAFITAFNGGATAVLQIQVMIDVETTTIAGIVQLLDGTPLGSVTIDVLEVTSPPTVSNSDGSFLMPVTYPASTTDLTVTAEITVLGSTLMGATVVQPVPDVITDAGFITITCNPMAANSGPSADTLTRAIDSEPPSLGEVGSGESEDTVLAFTDIDRQTRPYNPPRLQSVGVELQQPPEVQMVNLSSRASGDSRAAMGTSCSGQQVTYSDLDFDNVDVNDVTPFYGLSEGEMVAASYTIPAGAFPIEINLAEMVFEQSTNVDTTTGWSMLVWEGTPDTGNLVGEIMSDGSAIPHLFMQSGNVATVLAVAPGAGSIIVNDIGSATFSVGFRIDMHNNQTQNPCIYQVPSNSNAFLARDIGLSDGQNNWMNFLYCGPLACVDGWRRFDDLGPCEPNGDWGLRVSWTSTADCDLDGMLDYCEILADSSLDLDCNGVLDECQDCNSNGIFDFVEIVDGATDCNDNGIPDECEVPPIGPPSNDCNGNDLPDDCDIAGGGSLDCNSNATPDECEVPPIDPAGDDINNNGVPDECDCGPNLPMAVTYADLDFDNFEFFDVNPAFGFAGGQILAASYTAPAAAFPIEINLAEMVFAQSTKEETTTEWTMLVWEGTPDTGNLVGQIMSDGSAIPHLVIDSGDVATVLAVAPDAGSIIVEDIGAATFSVGFRIDKHHAPSKDPCAENPSESSNAFPAVDAFVSDDQNNWIMNPFDCGPLGCVDGWKRFADVFNCEPDGDWALRVSWTPTLDCNGNGVPDFCDIADGTSLDIDGNGIPDECRP